jgi:pantoate--beta-alanine ligase
MRIIERVDELRAVCERARAGGERVGLVPTMGGFHEGHRSLMRAARADNDFVVVTLFVNPRQFGDDEDLDDYPRDLDGDCTTAAIEGVDVLFAPSVEEIYRPGAKTTVHVAGLGEGLCGASRPTHFDGVTTIVAKLFAIVGQCRAYFGRKDAQQLAVIRRMTEDLDLPVDVVGCPLVREPDGLAMSSRNAYLSPDDRRAASVLHRALLEAWDAIDRGARDISEIRQLIVSAVDAEPGAELEYAEVRSATNLESLSRLEGDALVAVAARVGSTRLIDNMSVSTSTGVSADLGVTLERHS